MRTEDYEDFAKLIDDTYDLIGSGEGKKISGAAKALFFKALGAYPLQNVRWAIGAHIKDAARGKFTPKPADIIDKIETAQKDTRPADDEAWAIALTSRDEAATVVWTAETAEAFSACRPVLDTGDEIGARMAFKAAYKRLVETARADRRPVVWSISEGWDKLSRNAAVSKAVLAGLLPAPDYLQLESNAPASGAEESPEDVSARANLQRIREMLAASNDEKARAVEAAAQRERDEVAAAKKHQADLAANYQEKP